MIIKIGLPLSFSEIGLKDNQEDFVFPSPQEVSKDDKVFILCDGMGGHSHGEVASRTVATALGQYMKWHFPSDGILTKEVFNEGLNYAYEQLNLVDDGAPKKMGTTLTFVCFHRNGCLCAHIGDSRIYIVRPSERRVVYRSEDHSLVNDLIRAGELTPEEAASYPHKNIITRAMQPNQEKPAKAEISNLQDIQSGDYVFQCCDGILENLSDDKLIDILSNHETDDVNKLAAIKNVCFGKTKDNYTCYLIPVVFVKVEESVVNNQNSTSVSATSRPHFIFSKRHNYSAKKWVWLAFVFALLVLFIIIFGKPSNRRSEKSNQDKFEIVAPMGSRDKQ